VARRCSRFQSYFSLWHTFQAARAQFVQTDTTKGFLGRKKSKHNRINLDVIILSYRNSCVRARRSIFNSPDIFGTREKTEPSLNNYVACRTRAATKDKMRHITQNIILLGSGYLLTFLKVCARVRTGHEFFTYIRFPLPIFCRFTKKKAFKMRFTAACMSCLPWDGYSEVPNFVEEFSFLASY
jgi:hypothetical protein